jgi:toxin HigB-1
MIKSFRHKGLRRFFEKSDYRGIPPNSSDRIKRMLDKLDAATVPEDMNIAGYGFHALRGDRKGTYSTTITGNYRLTFTFDAEGAKNVRLEDYH